MKTDLCAEKIGFEYFKVYYLANSHYKVTDVKIFRISAQKQWKAVFYVAFASLHKLHRTTNENYFSVYFSNENDVDKLAEELVKNGKVYLKDFLI